MSLMDRAENAAFRGLFQMLKWAFKMAIYLVWASMKALWFLPKNVRIVWREIRFGPIRCEICEADLGGVAYCGVCGSHQGIPGAEGAKATLEEAVSAGPAKIPLNYYDWARRISFGSATVSIALTFGLYLLIALVFVLFPGQSGNASTGIGGLLTTIAIIAITPAVLCAPALYFMANRWRLPFSLRSALLWSLVSLFFVSISANSSFTSGGLFQVVNIVVLAGIVLTVALVLFQVAYPYLLPNQAQRWDEFFVASLSQIGYAGRPGGQLSLASLDPELVEIGQQGEQQTAEAARGSLESKSILFNSILDASAGGLGDLDHAVVVGNQLLLLDSKRWRSAYYRVSQGNVLRDGQPFEGGNISLGQWAAHYRRLFGSEIQIRGFVILTNPAAIVEGDPRLSQDVELISLSEFVETLEQLKNQNTALPNANAVRYFANLLSDPQASMDSAEMDLTPVDSYLVSKDLRQDLRNLFRRPSGPPDFED